MDGIPVGPNANGVRPEPFDSQGDEMNKSTLAIHLNMVRLVVVQTSNQTSYKTPTQKKMIKLTCTSYRKGKVLMVKSDVTVNQHVRAVMIKNMYIYIWIWKLSHIQSSYAVVPDKNRHGAGAEPPSTDACCVCKR